MLVSVFVFERQARGPGGVDVPADGYVMCQSGSEGLVLLQSKQSRRAPQRGLQCGGAAAVPRQRLSAGQYGSVRSDV